MPNSDSFSDYPPPASKNAEKPFAIVLHQRDKMPNGYFRPDATVTLGSALRTSGLLLALPPDELQSLLLMLTFVTSNGRCQPTVQQIVGALRVSEAKVRTRMKRPQDFQWQGHPLVTELKRDTGMDGFALSPAIVSLQDASEPTQEDTPSLPPSSRDAIIARSRDMYARPRAEVESMIAEQMGWKELGDHPEAQLRRKLLGVVGLVREQVDLLIARYPLESIERQLDWLPYRNAKSPARFLMAAVENDYDPPPGIRLRMETTRAEGQHASTPEGTLPNQTLSHENKIMTHKGDTAEPNLVGDAGHLAIPELEPEMEDLDIPSLTVSESEAARDESADEE